MTKGRIANLLLAMAVLTACAGDDTLLKFPMEGDSMSPTIEADQEVKVLDYGQQSPQRGDMVAFLAPTSVNRMFVKRIVGLPGETLEVDGTISQVVINGELLSEPYSLGPTVFDSVYIGDSAC